MTDIKICDWLMDNADAPIRYRIARELLKDEQTSKKIEPELLENPNVVKWLPNIQGEVACHGCLDTCFENVIPKLVQLGLHGGLPKIKDSINNYIENGIKNVNNFCPEEPPYRSDFWSILIANFISMADVKIKLISKYMSDSLNEMYNFTKHGDYDIYLNEEEKSKLPGIPKKWWEKKVIKPELLKEYGFGYPMIYDIAGLYRLYDLKNPEVDKKIDNIISYISTDEFHSKIQDGYGICVEKEYARYHGMGWDPKYPGWFDVADYIETKNIKFKNNGNVPKLLFFAQNVSKYPVALKTKWFGDLLKYFEKYKTDNGTYIFPKEWLKESPGYAVQGHHISFGENRRKKNWCEIESTFYVHLLQQNI